MPAKKTPITRSLSVKTILLNDKGEFLLLRRSAASKNNAGRWELPGGKVDPNEEFTVALARELKEETGLDMELVRPLETAKSDLPDRQVVYLVMLAEAASDVPALSSEHDAFKWVSPDKGVDEYEIVPQFRGAVRHYLQYIESLKPARPKPSDRVEVKPGDLDAFLARFGKASGRLNTGTAFLVDCLKGMIKPRFPLADISGRPKGLASFAMKIIKKSKYNNPMKQLTDLVGVRIIVHLNSEVETVGKILRQNFRIDEENSLDMLSRLGPDKFGYRSVHYIVELAADKPACCAVPRALVGLKAEIQVRTIAQHAWSDVAHDRLYKGNCEVSDYWKRESNRVAALLEAADEELQRLVDGIAFYEAHQPRCPDCASAQTQIEQLRVVRKHAPKDLNLALRHARLAHEIEDWAEVMIATVNGDYAAQKPILLALRGHARHKLAKNNQERRAAWMDMENAALLAPYLAEPRLLFAECMEELERDADALEQYRLAFEAEPDNPSALSGYIRNKALSTKDMEFISMARPAILKAIERCGQLADAGADLPRSYYRVAGFRQLLGPEEEWESLAMLALAVNKTRTAEELLRALSNADLLSDRMKTRQDILCARRFLYAALRFRFPGYLLPVGFSQPRAKRIPHKGPFVIVAGGCDPLYEEEMKHYRPLLRDAFRDFEGVVISGGTTQGVSGLMGEIAAESNGRIYAIGHLPPILPNDGTATEDVRYQERRRTDSKRRFSALEPIQYWLDLLATGVDPKDVRLLGINGGRIAHLEYRFALALGAHVALLHGSGREAERFLKEWPREKNDSLLVIPQDGKSIRAFLHLGVGSSKVLTPEIIEEAAQLSHEDFLDQQRYTDPNPVMQPWAKLREDIKESNRSQFAYIESNLKTRGYGIRAASGKPASPEFTKADIESMAEVEHGRWVVERIQSGWTYGKVKDAEKKTSPYLVGWDALTDPVRKWDRNNVRLWPELLARFGLEIYRLPKDEAAPKKARPKKK